MKWFSRFRLPAQKTCLLCHDSSNDKPLCANCLADLSVSFVAAELVCPCCGGKGNGRQPCGECQNQPQPYQRLWSSAYYEPPVSGVLHEFKHQGCLNLADALAEMMIANPPPWLENAVIDGVLAMPISQARRIERGFNQCTELLARLTEHYGWTILPESWIFREHKPPQSTLNHAERLRNIRKTFRIDGNVKNRNLLLIDDVVTTGATVGELAQSLRRSGAAAVLVWTATTAKVKKF